MDILNDSRDSVEVALSGDGSWEVTQTADSDLSDDDDDDYALLPPSQPAKASGSSSVTLCHSGKRLRGSDLKLQWLYIAGFLFVTQSCLGFRLSGPCEHFSIRLFT